MDKSWLKRQITDKELETRITECKNETDSIQIPYEEHKEGEIPIDAYSIFGTGLQVSVEYLQSIRSDMNKRDQLWIFKSPDESWEYLAGRAGFSIVRDDKIIESYLLIMS